MRDSWEEGKFDATFTAEYIARNSAAKGAASAYIEVRDVTIDDLFGEEE